MKHWTRFGILLFMLLTLSLSGCSQSQPPEPERPVVAVTIVPEEAFVKAVCGDTIDIITLVPPGGSPASYEPSPKEMAQFDTASLYFTIGVPTEKANLLPTAESRNIPVFSLAEASAAVYPERELSDGQRDPHIWLSPKRVAVMVQAIADQLSQLVPDQANTYAENATAFIETLTTLDSDLSELLSGATRPFFVSHPAFGYLAEDYGLEMIALEQDGKEASPQRLRELIDTARAQHINTVFYPSESSGRQAQSFAAELDGQAIPLSPLSEDYVNNLRDMAQKISEVTR